MALVIPEPLLYTHLYFHKSYYTEHSATIITHTSIVKFPQPVFNTPRQLRALSTPNLPSSPLYKPAQSTRLATRPSPLRRTYTTPTKNITMTASHPVDPAVTRVLVVGGSYAGLSATVNLLDLGNHANPRFNYPNYKHDADAPRTPIEVTIVDERDGFCTDIPP